MIIYDTEWLREKINTLPPIVSDFESSWPRYRRALRNHALSEDPNQLCRWSTVQAGMYVGEQEATTAQFKYLKSRPRFMEYDRGITESQVGSPYPVSFASYASGYSIHLTTYIAKWEECTGKNIEDQHTIVEFGGGYGLMCAIARRMGFTGDYIIVDFPEMCLLQEYYLGNLGYKFDPRPIDEHGSYDLLPRDIDLMVACYSLSEAPIDERDGFISMINPRSVMIAYQSEFEGRDNQTYFHQYAQNHSEYDWHFIPNPFFFFGEEHWYLIGDMR